MEEEKQVQLEVMVIFFSRYVKLKLMMTIKKEMALKLNRGTIGGNDIKQL